MEGDGLHEELDPADGGVDVVVVSVDSGADSPWGCWGSAEVVVEVVELVEVELVEVELVVEVVDAEEAVVGVVGVEAAATTVKVVSAFSLLKVVSYMFWEQSLYYILDVFKFNPINEYALFFV